MRTKSFLIAMVSATLFLSALLFVKASCQADKVVVKATSIKEVDTLSKKKINTLILKNNDFKYVDAPANAKMTFPLKQWESTLPENVGWSSAKLERAKDYYEKLHADALLVVVNGLVIASWGEPAKIIESRSMRKSFLSSLYGIYSEDGKIDLRKSLKDLAINDHQQLTATEQEATIEDLLTSRSGVYHPAAYATSRSDQPERGSHLHGTHFFYNNWDFNALGYIFNKLTSSDLFNEFQNKIAIPIGMQDFALDNTEYRFENASKYPAYLFSTSARDDARYGLLYLNKGNWNGRQVIPENWITKSTSKIVDTQYGEGYSGYGYLWWTEQIGDAQVYLSRGNGGQYLFVDPSKNIVVVFRANPGSIVHKWLGLRVDEDESWELLKLILSSRE